MSKTWRNRHAVPKGLKVRDGIGWAAFDSEGRQYYFDTRTHIDIVYRRPVVFNPYWGFTIIKPSIFERWKMEMFSNTKVAVEKRYVKKFRKSQYSKESKSWKKFDRRRRRAKERDLLKQNRWDDFEKEMGTCGWNTW